jgi:hypothetical protein
VSPRCFRCSGQAASAPGSSAPWPLPCWAESSSLTRLSTFGFRFFSTGAASCGGEGCTSRRPWTTFVSRHLLSTRNDPPPPANCFQPEKPSCPQPGRADQDGWTGAVAWLSTGSPRKDSKNGQAENGTAKSRGSTRGTSTSEWRIGISFTASAGDAFPPDRAPGKPARRRERQSGAGGWPSSTPASRPRSGRHSARQQWRDGLNRYQHREREHSDPLRLDFGC